MTIHAPGPESGFNLVGPFTSPAETPTARPEADPFGYPARHAGTGPTTGPAPDDDLLVRTALAHLLRSAADAVVTGREDQPDVDLRIRVRGVPVDGALVVHDDGPGLSAVQVRRLFADPTADMTPSGLDLDDLVQLEALGAVVRACLRVADSVVLRSRHGGDEDAPTLRGTAGRDGSVSVEHDEEPLARPGTEVRLHLGAGDRTALADLPAVVAELADQLDVPVDVDDRSLVLPGPVWSLRGPDRRERLRDLTGDEPIATFDLGVGPFGTRAVAVVPARPVLATRTQAQRVYVDGVLLPNGRARLVPPWVAAFCTVVLDAGLLPMTPEADALSASAGLDEVGEHLESRLLIELLLLADLDPERFAAIVDVHADALLAAGLAHPDLLALVRTTVPLPTTLGAMTLDDLASAPEPIPYARADAWDALRERAVRDRVLVVDARGAGVARLVDRLGEDGPAFVALRPEDLA